MDDHWQRGVAVFGREREGFYDDIASLELVQCAVGGVSPCAVFCGAELAISARGIGLRNQFVFAGVWVGHCHRARGGEYSVGFC